MGPWEQGFIFVLDHCQSLVPDTAPSLSLLISWGKWSGKPDFFGLLKPYNCKNESHIESLEAAYSTHVFEASPRSHLVSSSLFYLVGGHKIMTCTFLKNCSDSQFKVSLYMKSMHVGYTNYIPSPSLQQELQCYSWSFCWYKAACTCNSRASTVSSCRHLVWVHWVGLLGKWQAF